MEHFYLFMNESFKHPVSIVNAIHYELIHLYIQFISSLKNWRIWKMLNIFEKYVLKNICKNSPDQ